MKNKLPDPALTERWHAAAELLEAIARNRDLLARVPEAERTRLMKAAGQISRPDAVARRQLVKATKRQRKAGKSQRAEKALNQTGIRKLRRQTVFTTPNVFPPADFKQIEIENDPDFREAVEEQNCYVCKQDYSHHPPFLRPALSEVRGIEFFQTHRDRPICAGAWRCSPAAA